MFTFSHPPSRKWSSSAAYAIASKKTESQENDFTSAVHQQQQILMPSFYKRAFQRLLKNRPVGSFSLAHARAGNTHDSRQRASSFAHAQTQSNGAQAIARASSSAYSYG